MGCGCASLGDDITSVTRPTGSPKPVDPIVYLKAHLNRYTLAGGAPPQTPPIATTELSLTPVLDNETATRAVWVVNLRAANAKLASPDPSTDQMLKQASQAWNNPTQYVQTNLPWVTDVVRLYGDSLHLPKAKGVPVYVKVPVIGEVSEQTLLVGAGAALAIYFLTKKRRRR